MKALAECHFQSQRKEENIPTPKYPPKKSLVSQKIVNVMGWRRLRVAVNWSVHARFCSANKNDGVGVQSSEMKLRISRYCCIHAWPSLFPPPQFSSLLSVLTLPRERRRFYSRLQWRCSVKSSSSFFPPSFSRNKNLKSRL